jgi:MtN3 and saliva related transmembrane protein
MKIHFKIPLVEIIGFIAGVLTSSSLLPQLIKTIRKKEAEDISIWMPIVLMSGVSLWIYYGIMKDDYPIILTNAFSLLLNISLIFLRVKYSR